MLDSSFAVPLGFGRYAVLAAVYKISQGEPASDSAELRRVCLEPPGDGIDLIVKVGQPVFELVEKLHIEVSVGIPRLVPAQGLLNE